MSPRKRVAILVSGRGSNMRALIEAAEAPDYPAEIVGVLSNKADAPALDYAQSRRVPTAVRAHRDYADRESFDAALDAALEGWDTEIVCLAGFMRILTPGFVAKWTGRLVNIHPSLLPDLPGLRTHERAIAAGLAEHGCTVHFVTTGVDEGPPILQARVPVLPGDTAESLAERVLAEEHRIYPAALAMVCRGEAELAPATPGSPYIP